jgi:hypothetical protein
VISLKTFRVIAVDVDSKELKRQKERVCFASSSEEQKHESNMSVLLIKIQHGNMAVFSSRN